MSRRAPWAPFSGRSNLYAGLLGGLLGVGFLAGCDDDTTFVVPTEQPDLGCQVANSRTFQVFFVVDVSNSVAANDVLDAFQQELVDFAFAFPEFDSNENRVLVDYYVIGFVNNFGYFPEGSERMTSPLAVSEALEQAQSFGQMQTNTEVEENLLDALDAVFDEAFDTAEDGSLDPVSDRILVIGTTDDNFVDQGELLNPVVVQTSYAELSDRLTEVSDVMSVFMFTPGNIEGIDRNFRLMEPLPIEDRFDLSTVVEGSGSVGRILSRVAVEAACAEGSAP